MVVSLRSAALHVSADCTVANDLVSSAFSLGSFTVNRICINLLSCLFLCFEQENYRSCMNYSIAYWPCGIHFVFTETSWFLLLNELFIANYMNGQYGLII